MQRYYILRDGKLEASTATREAAIDLIRLYQAEEKKKHLILRAEFSLIQGWEQTIEYTRD